MVCKSEIDTENYDFRRYSFCVFVPDEMDVKIGLPGQGWSTTNEKDYCIISGKEPSIKVIENDSK